MGALSLSIARLLSASRFIHKYLLLTQPNPKQMPKRVVFNGLHHLTDRTDRTDRTLLIPILCTQTVVLECHINRILDISDIRLGVRSARVKVAGLMLASIF